MFSSSSNNSPPLASTPNNNSAAMVLAALAARSPSSTNQASNNAATDLLMPLLLNGWLAALKQQAQLQQPAHHLNNLSVTVGNNSDAVMGQSSPESQVADNNYDPDEPLNLSVKSPENLTLSSSQHNTRFDPIMDNVGRAMSPSLSRRRGRPLDLVSGHRRLSGIVEPLSKRKEIIDDVVGTKKAGESSTSSATVRGRGGGHNKTPKRFHCNQCGRGFTRSDGLQRHLRLHSGYRPFTCTVCRRSFSRSDHAQVHIRRHFLVNSASASATPINSSNHAIVATYPAPATNLPPSTSPQPVDRDDDDDMSPLTSRSNASSPIIIEPFITDETA